LAEDDGLVILGDEEAVEDVAVFEFDAEGAVTGFHGGVRCEDGAEEGFEAIRGGAVQDGADLAALAGDGVAGLAGLREEGFAVSGVAGLAGE
jgi:hypothetical protein